MTDLDPNLTFETFVVGPANRLAAAAARRAADSPGTSYNPLFLYAASGLGKSHVLTAVAHHARKSNARLRLLYQSLESYLEELTASLETGQRDQLRDRYRDLDILLLDDVQFLADQPEAQEMLLSTLDSLTSSGSQIILASDRPPADINGLDARLVSRFSGGLIVDIAAPDYETRVAILRRKVEDRGQTLQRGVAEALARYPLRNIRELGGALNRILAVQDLEGRRVVPEDVPVLMGEERPVQPDDFDSFMDEIASTLAESVQEREQPWRRALREAADAAEREGVSAHRLREALQQRSAPEGWEGLLDGFRADVARLREIDRELDRLGNPWQQAQRQVVSDPDRLDEAESFLASVIERTRPFPVLAAGPGLDRLGDRVPGLALKAARQLVQAERPDYNPLFLWSTGGVAARAVMAAAGRDFLQARPAGSPGSVVAVTSVSDFAEDFIRALSSGVAGAWRERWWTVDLLLVHGAEALSETERAQDEFFHLFEALKRRGSRVLITADRAPSGIEGIDERLRSRFEGGLVLEVDGPNLSAEAGRIDLVEPGSERAADVAGRELPMQPGAGVGSRTGEDEGREGRAAAPHGDDLLLEAGYGRFDATGMSGSARDARGRPLIPPLNELDFGEGRGGLFLGGQRSAKVRGASGDVVDRWLPAPEEVRAERDRAGREGAPEGVPTETGEAGGEEEGERGAGWRPSKENVVWSWPVPTDRLVEDLE